jgi:glutaredoxin
MCAKGGSLHLTIYTRAGCHLCDDMKAIVARVAGAPSHAIAIDEVDISSDPDLEERYGQEIPVLFVNGRKAAKYRITESELRKILAARSSP